jgi:hypothetical protein
MLASALKVEAEAVVIRNGQVVSENDETPEEGER